MLLGLVRQKVELDIGIRDVIRVIQREIPNRNIKCETDKNTN
jgi:hypothetical protein